MYRLFLYLLTIGQPTLAILTLLSMRYNIPHIKYISQGFWWLVSFNLLLSVFLTCLGFFGLIILIKDDEKEKLTEIKKTLIDNKNYLSKIIYLINIPVTIGVFFVTNSPIFFLIYVIGFFICKAFKLMMISEIKNYFKEQDC